MVASSMRTEVGRVLGDRYRILAPIGDGRSAQVFLAEDLRLHRRVAVKVLQPSRGDRELLGRFQQEAQATAALNHPNVLSVFDWGDDDGHPFLVAEYLAAGSLRGMLDLGHRLTPAQALRVGLDAARGLDDAHRHGVIHGDLHPSDLLFDSDGRLRIADFGLTRSIEAGPAPVEGEASAMRGSSAYAAPEQLGGHPATDASDVYALGVVLTEAVTGTAPRPSAPNGTVDRTVGGPETLGPLAAVLEKATRADPVERPSAHDLAAELVGAARAFKRPAPLPLVPGPRLAESETASPNVPLEEPTAVVPAVGPEPTRHVVVPAPLPPTDPAVHTLEQVPRYEVVDVRPRRRWPLVVLLLLLVGVVAGAFALVRAADSGYHRVPDINGEQLSQALPKVAGYGWRITLTHTRKDGAPPVQVLSATPKVGSRLRKGDRLTLLVSDGNTLVRVPVDVRGKSLSDAQAEIQASGLLIKPMPQFDEDIAKDHAIGLGPNTPPDLPKLDAVVLVVSNGPAPRTIPQGLSGLTYDVAAQKLNDLRLKPIEVDQYNDDKSVQAGQVFDTNPKADVQVQRDSEVQLIVSKGPTPVTVPNVATLTADAAKTVLTNAGFAVAPNVVQSFNDMFPAGQVIGTSPPAGDKDQPGSTVSLIVSRGQDLVTVPPVYGTQSIAEAVALVQASGLQVGGAIGLPTGKPIRTDPPAGTQVKRGGVVNLVLG